MCRLPVGGIMGIKRQLWQTGLILFCKPNMRSLSLLDLPTLLAPLEDTFAKPEAEGLFQEELSWSLEWLAKDKDLFVNALLAVCNTSIRHLWTNTAIKMQYHTSKAAFLGLHYIWYELCNECIALTICFLKCWANSYGSKLLQWCRTVIVDNNTWNNTHIATVGRAMSSPEKKAWEEYRKLDVGYVLVVFGGFIGSVLIWSTFFMCVDLPPL